MARTKTNTKTEQKHVEHQDASYKDINYIK